MIVSAEPLLGFGVFSMTPRAAVACLFPLVPECEGSDSQPIHAGERGKYVSVFLCTVPRGPVAPGRALSNKWLGAECVRFNISIGTYIPREGYLWFTESQLLYRDIRKKGRTGDPPVPGIPSQVGLITPKTRARRGREKSQPDSCLPPWASTVGPYWTACTVVFLEGLEPLFPTKGKGYCVPVSFYAVFILFPTKGIQGTFGFTKSRKIFLRWHFYLVFYRSF